MRTRTQHAFGMPSLDELAPDVRQRIAEAIAGHHILEDVVRWSARTGRAIGSIVTQDEFTHDVVVRWDEALWLVYDCT